MPVGAHSLLHSWLPLAHIKRAFTWDTSMSVVPQPVWGGQMCSRG